MNMNNTRFLLCTLLVFALAGCGGDANTGSNGTGIQPVPTEPTLASGPVNSLGPLGVGGARLNDTGTSVQVDFDTQRPATELRLGMLANAEGLVSLSTNSGVATTAVAQSYVLGPLTDIDPARQGLHVMGVSVRADSNTLLDGVASLGEMAPGDRVEVYGLRLPAGQGLLATRLIVRKGASNATVEAIGIVPDFSPFSPFIDTQGLTIDLRGVPNAASLQGAAIRVRGTYDAASNSLAATLVTSTSPPASSEGKVAYVEGFVLTQLAPTRVVVGDFLVDTSGIGASFPVGARVSLRGRVSGGMLVADQYTVIANGAKIEYTVEGTISQYVSLSDFTVRGERIDASQAAISGGSASMLGQGRAVRVRGVAGPGKINAAEVTLE
jgi:hypothetical protein